MEETEELDGDIKNLKEKLLERAARLERKAADYTAKAKRIRELVEVAEEDDEVETTTPAKTETVAPFARRLTKVEILKNLLREKPRTRREIFTESGLKPGTVQGILGKEKTHFRLGEDGKWYARD